MSNLPPWLTFLVATMPAYLTFGVALIVAWVGYQQFRLAREQGRLAREKFKLDLFEKRFAVYKAAQKFLSIILRDAKIDLADLFEYRRDTQDAVFLFDQEIVQ